MLSGALCFISHMMLWEFFHRTASSRYAYVYEVV
jgi:hypothetical protein